MALRASREGLRKELVDYLGNIIITENLKSRIINAVSDNFVTQEELIGSGLLQTDLLWTNASPTSSFPKQTINIDLSNYKMVFISFIMTGTTYKASVLCIIDNTNYLAIAINPTIRYRFVGASNSGVLIGTAFLLTDLNTEVANNDEMIPYQIYGVK